MSKKLSILIAIGLVVCLAAGNGYGAQIPIPDGFPKASNTGLAGVGLTVNDLTTYTGSLTITTNGTTIEQKDITGCLHIQANNVTVKKCRLRQGGWYGIQANHGYTGTIIEDCLIEGPDQPGIAVLASDTTIRRCDVSGYEDCIVFYTNVNIIDNYCHGLVETSTSHNDCIQLPVGGNCDIIGNTLQALYQTQTSAMLIQSNFGPVDDVWIEGNFLSGGAYTVYSDDQFYGAPTNITFKDNVWEKDSWQYGYLSADGNPTFICNTFHTGEPVPANPACDTSNQPPVADAGADRQVTDTDDNGSEQVTLDGSGSYDPDGSITGYVWKEGTTQVGTGVSPNVVFNVGAHTVTLTVTDNDSATDTDNVVINVAAASDTTAPSPNPMTWNTVPYATSGSSIRMIATTATDASGVQYYFDCTTAGGHDSGWQDSTIYEDTGLSTSTQYSYQVKARDKSTNQNETSYSTLRSATTESSTAVTSTTAWQSFSFSSQSGALIFEFDATPNLNSMDGLVGVLNGTAAGYNDLACILRFNDYGNIDVRNGDSYAADVTLPYSAGTTYYVEMDINISGHKYDVYVTPEGQSEVTLASGYDFRTSQQSVSSLDHWTLVHETGSLTVDNVEATTGGGDTTAPSPDPMTWATEPYATGTSSISMTATTATDASGVEYYFECTAGGGNSSSWQDSTTYQDTGLSPSTQYSYRVEARDKSANQNETAYSTVKSATTQSAGDTTAPSPDPMTWATEPYATSSSSISMTATTATDASGVEYYFECTAGGGHSSGWQDGTTYQDTGLNEQTQYSYRVKARDKSGNQNETAYSTVKSATTETAPDTTAPSPDPMTWATEPYAASATSVAMTATTATDDSAVEYYFDCTAGGGSDSGWQDSTTYIDTGLSELTQYSYRVKARDKSTNQNETAYSTVKSATTPDGSAPSPNPMTWATEPHSTGTTSIAMTATTATDTSGVEYYFDCTTAGGHDSGWQDSTSYEDTALNSNSTYNYQVKARDKSSNLNETAYSTLKSATTDTVVVPPPSPTGYLKLDETSGTTATDSSGNGYDGTVSGAAWTSSGHTDGALSFSSTSDRCQIPGGALSASQGSITLWGRASGTQSATRYYFGHSSNPSGWADRIQLYLDNGDMVLNLGLGDTHTRDTGIMTLSTDAWYHVALTWNGSNYFVYVNGAQKATGSYTGLSTIGTFADIGNDGSNAERTEAFTGRIDDVRIFDKTLDPDEVFEIYSGVVFTASSPSPADNANNVSVDAVLSWTAGAHAAYHEVYLGTNYNSVADASHSSSEYMGNYSTSSFDPNAFDPNLLAYDTTYYWAVDEVNGTSFWMGDIWSFVTQAASDTTAPSPNPMTWATEPYATGASSISMTATTATDASGVEYYFECTAGGGHSSSWQDSVTYTDTGLSELTQYSYRVKARDKSSNHNETAYSTVKSATTQDGTAPAPNPMTWATEPYETGTSSISMTATTATDASGVEYYFECTAGGGHSSSWQDSSTYQDTGLSASTQYSYRVKARDKSTNQNETAYSTVKSATTDASAEPTDINGNSADTSVEEDGYVRWGGEETARSGGADTDHDHCFVLVFELPTLGQGQTITAANLKFYYEGTGYYTPQGNIDVHGLDYRTTSSVVSGDFYQGSFTGDENSTGIQDDIVTPSTSTGTINTSSSADTALKNYLNAQYTAGAEGGDYVFLRINNDINETNSPQRYYEVSTANHSTSSQRPVLTVTIE